MSIFNGKYFSIVFIGKQNPAILNHDFLERNNVIPREKEPFSTLYSKNKGKPFNDTITTQIFAAIRYDHISITVEENKFQIIDEKLGDPTQSPILPMTKKYFGELLRYTPMKLGGINFNGEIEFKTQKDQDSFDAELGISKSKLKKKIDEKKLTVGVIFSFPWENGIVQVQIPKPKDRAKRCAVNFNYEFKFSDMDTFLKNLNDTGKAHKKFIRFLKLMGLENI